MIAPLSRSVTTELTRNCPGTFAGLTSTSMPSAADGVGCGSGMFAVAPKPKPARTATANAAMVLFIVDASIELIARSKRVGAFPWSFLADRRPECGYGRGFFVDRKSLDTP